MSHQVILQGQVLRYVGSPFDMQPTEAVVVDPNGAVLLSAGRIADIGPAQDVIARHPGVEIESFDQGLIMPGFIDAHVHYPQTAMIASWGKRLIDWLNTYTFPEEMRFSDSAYAAEISARYLDLTTQNGTTSVCSYCTIHPESVDAFFTEAQSRGQRVFAGKTCMDRNAPDGLVDNPQTAYDQSKALLQNWHDVDRLSYVITPRFSPTSTPAQLEALGSLWAEHPEVLMQTHLSEQTDEIDWVKSLYPKARDYLDTYESFGLLGSNGLYGHAIHLEPREKDRLREVGAALIHCPTSNTFIGSGLFDMAGLMASGQRIGLATDTGGGSSFSMLRTMAAAYEIAQLRGTALHPAQLLWLATFASAQALRVEDKVGRLEIGHEADVIVVNLASTEAISQRSDCATDIWEAVFPTIMMGDDRAIDAVYIAGRRAV